MTTGTDHAQKTNAARSFTVDELKHIASHLEQAVRIKDEYWHGEPKSAKECAAIQSRYSNESLVRGELAELILSEMGSSLSETNIHERNYTTGKQTLVKYDMTKMPSTWASLDDKIKAATQELPKMLNDGYDRFITSEGGTPASTQEMADAVGDLTKELERLAPRTPARIR